MTMLSDHFSLRELTRSDTAMRLGIANIPEEGGTNLLRRVCNEILEPVRAHFGRPVRVNSGYRSIQLNARIPGSSNTSEDTLCMAADFEVDGVSNLDTAQWMRNGGLAGFGQLILEAYTSGDPHSGWVHCSLPSERHSREVLTMKRQRLPNGRVKSVYFQGLAP
jgi:zinc D-Ala-D-Ala carboxypeptidase